MQRLDGAAARLGFAGAFRRCELGRDVADLTETRMPAADDPPHQEGGGKRPPSHGLRTIEAVPTRLAAAETRGG